MNSTATPRKLVGHEAKWRAVARAFAAGKVPQTLLISGPANIGKSTFALRFSQLLLCPQPLADDNGLPRPCGACRTCHQVEIGTFPDYRVTRPIVSAAKDEKDRVVAPEALESGGIYIDMARDFGGEAMRKPMIGARKVMVLIGADKMSTEAQNALLKTFEEPVPGLSILLIATNPDKLLPTVRSRAWHLPLGLVSDTEIAQWLSNEFESASIDMQNAVVRMAAGRPGSAWREIERLRADDNHEPRFEAAQSLIDRIASASPVGALALTEEAQTLAKTWWGEDQDGPDLKKGDAKVARSAATRFLDELANAYRQRWKTVVADGDKNGSTGGETWALGLDQIRKTRHYILGNANATLALDVMFGRLIALHHR